MDRVRWNNFPRRAGVSMLEIVVVVALIAIMSGVALPRFSAATARYQADLAARKVAADLEQARRNARQTGSVMTVTFDLTRDSYVIPGDSGLTGGYSVNLRDSPYSCRISSATFAATGTQLTFDAWGQPTPASDNIITIRCGNQTRTVTVNGSSGVATWQ